MKMIKFLAILLAFIVLCTASISSVSAQATVYYLDRTHPIVTGGLSAATVLQTLRTNEDEPEYGTIDVKVSVNCSIRRVTVSGKVSWDVTDEGTTNQLTFVIANTKMGPQGIDEDSIEYLDQFKLNRDGTFSCTFGFGLREPVYGKEYYIYMGSWMLEQAFGSSFIYESAALNQIEINGNQIENFIFTKTAYSNLSSAEINANTMINVTPEDPQAITNIHKYDAASQSIVIDVISRNGTEKQKYYLSSTINSPLFKVNGAEISNMQNAYGQSLNVSVALGNENAILIVAEYYNGRLLSLHKKSGTNDIMLDIPIPDTGITSIKAFVWRDLDSIAPICAYQELI